MRKNTSSHEMPATDSAAIAYATKRSRYQTISYNLMKLVTVLLCLATVLFSTSWGAQFSFYLVNKLSPVTITYQHGTLLNDLQVSELHIKNDKATVELKNIRLRLHLRCLWKKELCIDELSIAQLNVTLLKQSTSQSPTVNTQVLVKDKDELAEVKRVVIPDFLPLPVNLSVKSFTLAKGLVQTPSVNVDFSNTELSLRVGQKANVNKGMQEVQELQINNASVGSIKLTLSDNDTVKPSNPPWFLSELPEISLPFYLTVGALSINDLLVNKLNKKEAVKTIVQTSAITTSLNWHRTALVIDKFSTKLTTINNTKLTDKVSLSAAIKLTSPYGLEANIVNKIRHLESAPQVEGSHQNIDITGDFSDLKINTTSKGTLALTGAFSVDLTDPSLPYDISAKVTKFTLPSRLTKTLNATHFALKSSGDLHKQNFQLNGNISGLGYQNIDLSLAAKRDDNTVEISRLSLQDDIDVNAVSMVGSLTFGSEIAWDAHLSSSGFTLPELEYDVAGRVQGSITTKGYWDDNEWAVQFVNSSLEGNVNNKPLKAKANVKINHDWQLPPSEVKIDYGDTSLNLSGYNDDNWHVKGIVNIDNTEVWLKGLKSKLLSQFDISGSVKQPKVSLKGELLDVNIANMTSEAILFNAKYQPLSDHTHQVNLNTAALTYAEHVLQSVKFSSEGNINAQNLKLNWLGKSSVDLKLNSQYLADKAQWQLSTEHAKLAYQQFSFNLAESLHLLFDLRDQRVAVTPHCWLGNFAKLCIAEQALLSKDKGELVASVDVDGALLNQFTLPNMDVELPVGGNINISWLNAMQPTVVAALLINSGQIKLNRDEKLLPVMSWHKGHLNLQLKNNILKNDIVLTSSDNAEIIALKTEIPLATGELSDGRVVLNDFKLSPLKTFVPELAQLAGTVDADLKLTGNILAPLILGEAHLSSGKIQKVGDINVLDKFTLNLNFTGKETTINGGLEINESAAAVTGNINWQSALQADINLSAEAVKLVFPPDLTLTVSPKLNAKITSETLALSGRVDVVDGKLSVEQLPQGSVSLSNDVIIVNGNGEPIDKEKKFEVLTNISVLLTDTFKLEGLGFVGRIGGELQVTQQSQQPLQLFGNLNLPEGRYRAYGQDLSLNKGNISFNGPVQSPFVAIQAIREIEKEDVVVGIDATGLATSLEVKLFSKPSMQQSEIMSYLIRGRGVDAETSGSTSATIGLALGTAVTNYSGVLTHIEKLPLINRIEIDGDDSQASIGGYLGDQVYVKYGIGVVEPINELTVRFYLLSRLWLETVSGIENSANLYYSFDIE